MWLGMKAAWRLGLCCSQHSSAHDAKHSITHLAGVLQAALQAAQTAAIATSRNAQAGSRQPDILSVRESSVPAHLHTVSCAPSSEFTTQAASQVVQSHQQHTASQHRTSCSANFVSRASLSQLGILHYTFPTLQPTQQPNRTGRVFENQPKRSYSTHLCSVTDSPCPHGPPAFVFDIDGVLIRGKQVLPAAQEAVKKLYDGRRWRYPVCFVTNGGGVTEAHKAAQLSHWLQADVHEEQVIQSHTPMKDLVHSLGQKPVLVSGRLSVLEVARHYGFERVLHTRELGRAMPAATPFSTYPPSDPANAPEPDPVRDLGLATEAAPIEAVFVMADPDDWYRDAQLIIDVLLSGGVPERKGGPSEGTPPVQLYFSNPDLLWANEFPRSRFGQGAFAHMVESLHQRMTGKSLPFVRFFGKPNPEPYRLAERLLMQQAKQMGLELPSVTHPEGLPPFSGIYAVGDNPAADVRGANAAGPPWVSVLVKTGVFQGPGKNCSIDSAQMVVEDVAAAVDAALHRTRSLRWHSMR